MVRESMDEWMSGNRDFYQKENLNQGLRAIKKNNFFYMCVFFFLLSTCFISFLKECKWTFLYLCNLILKTEVCDGANC